MRTPVVPVSAVDEQVSSARDSGSRDGPVAIVTDSISQLTPSEARDLRVSVVPMKLVLGDREYRDGIDITPAELYRRMREEKLLPQTSSPSVGDYQRVFTRLLEDGAGAVVCLTPSSRLAMAYNAAGGAAEITATAFPARRVEVIDTGMAGRAHGYVVLAAAQAAAAGAALEQVLAAARAARGRVGLVAAVDTLEYLVRGGRVSLAAGLLGGLLQVKPVLAIQDDGTAACIARLRTKRAALEYMLRYVAGRTGGHSTLQVAVMQADAPQEARELQGMVARSWPAAQVAVTDFTPVMGGHTGPGLIGLAYCYE